MPHPEALFCQPVTATPLFDNRQAAVRSDQELLALYLNGELPRRQLRAQALLLAAGTLRTLSRWSRPALVAAGLSRGEAERVAGLAELGQRILRRPVPARPIKEAQDAYAYLTSTLTFAEQERFVVLSLDAQHRPLELTVVAEGSVDACPVDPRKVFAAGLQRHASALLVAHNHPSGNLAPSAADLVLTRRINAGAQLLGLPLLDHLIVGHPDDTPPYASLAALNLLGSGPVS